MTEEQRWVELTSKDRETIRVERNAIEMCGLIKDMLEDAEEDVPTIPVPNVDKKTLDKVIEYCRYHWNNRADEIERPLKSKLEDVISQWDQTYVTIDKPFLVELIMAANYLNNKDLLDLTCAKVASTLKGKSPDKIKEMFGISSDFTPEEEAKIRDENGWNIAEETTDKEAAGTDEMAEDDDDDDDDDE